MADLKKAILAALITTMAAPVGAQSLFDQFKGLKASVEKLTGKKNTAVAAETEPNGQAQNASPSQSQDVGDAVFSAADLADDTSMTTLSAGPLIRNKVSTFDVKGFKLGMSPSEAELIIKKLRMTTRTRFNFQYTGDFELEATRIANKGLAREIKAKSKKLIRKAYGQTADGSEYEFTFTIEPGGARLSYLTYRTKQNGQSDQELLQALTAKYGSADRVYDKKLEWCGVKNCGNFAPTASFDQFNVDWTFQGQVRFTLGRSVNYMMSTEKALKDRAAQIAHQTGSKTSF